MAATIVGFILICMALWGRPSPKTKTYRVIVKRQGGRTETQWRQIR